MVAVTDISFPLVGDHVFLRPLCSADVPLLWDIENDPDVRRYLGGPLAGLASVKERFGDSPCDAWIDAVSKQCPDYRYLAVCLNQDDTFTGWASLQRHDVSIDRTVFELASLLVNLGGKPELDAIQRDC